MRNRQTHRQTDHATPLSLRYGVEIDQHLVKLLALSWVAPYITDSEQLTVSTSPCIIAAAVQLYKTGSPHFHT